MMLRRNGMLYKEKKDQKLCDSIIFPYKSNLKHTHL